MHNANRQLGVLVFVLMITISSVCLAADEGFRLNNTFFLHGRQLTYKPMPKKVCPGIIDENTKEIARKTVDYSILAESVYPTSKNNNEKVIIGVNSNYKKIDDIVESFGFHASVYKDLNSGKIVVSFEGTDPKSLKDWGTNALNFVGVEASQYTQAILLADKIKKKYKGKQVVLVGHSLGGGLAQNAAMFTGLPAYTFNAANVSKLAFWRYMFNHNRNNVVNVVNKREPLDHVNTITDAIGKSTDSFLFQLLNPNSIGYINMLKRFGTSGKIGKTIKVNFEADSYIARHDILLMANFLKCVAKNYPLPDDNSTDQVADGASTDDPTDDRNAGTLLPGNEYVIGQHIKQLPGILLPKPEPLPVVRPLPEIKPLPEVKPLPHVKPLPKPQKLPW